MTVLRYASSSLRRAWFTTSAFRDSFSLQSQHIVSPILTAGHAKSTTLHGLRNQCVWSYTPKACFASSSEGTEGKLPVGSQRYLTIQPNSQHIGDADRTLGRELQIRFVRIVAIGMLLVAATKVVPLMCRYSP